MSLVGSNLQPHYSVILVGKELNANLPENKPIQTLKENYNNLVMTNLLL